MSEPHAIPVVISIGSLRMTFLVSKELEEELFNAVIPILTKVAELESHHEERKHSFLGIPRATPFNAREAGAAAAKSLMDSHYLEDAGATEKAKP